jgi:hypothetical protein
LHDTNGSTLVINRHRFGDSSPYRKWTRWYDQSKQTRDMRGGSLGERQPSSALMAYVSLPVVVFVIQSE